MRHWFDRLAIRATDEGGADDGSFTRRTAVKSAAVGAVAASPLASPLVGRALGELAKAPGPCECQRTADQIAVHNNKKLISLYLRGGFLEPVVGVYVVAGLAGTFAGWTVSKFACGICTSNPSGGLGGGGGNGCPPGTTGCDASIGLCCFGTDVCCACNGEATCCIVEVGCSCCP